MKIMKLQGIILLCLFGLSAFAQQVNAVNAALLPPWYLLQTRLGATLNADPCVRVDNLTGEGRDMVINISVCSYDKARALAAFVGKKHEFGDNLIVTVNVISPDYMPVHVNLPENADEVADFLNRALTGNKYFVRAGSNKERGVYAEFKPAIVQYYSDDISDWYLNTNLVAAAAFSQALDLDLFSSADFKVYATTSRIFAQS